MTTNPNIELKPCPFCGSDNLELVHGDGDERVAESAWVDCDSCKAEGPFKLVYPLDADQSARLAVDAWNTRTVGTHND